MLDRRHAIRNIRLVLAKLAERLLDVDGLDPCKRVPLAQLSAQALDRLILRETVELCLLAAHEHETLACSRSEVAPPVRQGLHEASDVRKVLGRLIG